MRGNHTLKKKKSSFTQDWANHSASMCPSCFVCEQQHCHSSYFSKGEALIIRESLVIVAIINKRETSLLICPPESLVLVNALVKIMA